MELGLRIAEEEQASAVEKAAGSQGELFQKSHVVPASDGGFRDTITLALDKDFASAPERLGGEVLQRGVAAEHRGPVFVDGLLSDVVLLDEAEGGEAFAGARVEMTVPRDGHPLWSRRDFKKQNAPFGSKDFVNFPKGGAGVGALSNLVLEALEAGGILPVGSANDVPLFVIHAEHEPGGADAAQIGFIGQGGKVLADV